MAKSKSAKSVSPEVAETGKTAVPASRAAGPLAEFDRMFEHFFDRNWLRPLLWERPLLERLGALEPRMPKVDVVDRDGEVVVRAEVPGVERKDLDVTLTENTVTIKGETRRESREEKENYFRSEISHGSFLRTVGLPCEVDADKAKARFSDGVLELTLPKLRQSTRRRINVE